MLQIVGALILLIAGFAILRLLFRALTSTASAYYPFSLSLPRWRSMLCALVVFAVSFLSRMEESAERRSAAVVTRVVCLQGLWRVDYG